jgi:hypothetical protein
VKRIFVAEPNDDVRSLLELLVERLGHRAVSGGRVDAVLLEPGCAVARSELRRFRGQSPRIVCVSIHPPEHGLAPDGSVGYLEKPVSLAQLRGALADAFAS